jgi:glycosyltransferase involved in cell wall biosynthesis
VPLTVLSVAFPYAPVGACVVGGAEQILSEIDRALVAAGHTSLVIGCESSRPAGTLFPIRSWDTEALTESQKALTEFEVQRTLDAVLAYRAVDVVHMHCFDFHRYSISAGVPVLVTLHLPLAWYPAETWKRLASRVQFCCVSKYQRSTRPPELDGALVIENGVEMPVIPQHAVRDRFAVVLGRICPEKNQHAALEAGTKCGIPVILGGQVFPYPEHQQYFQQKVAPQLANSFHRFFGPLDLQQKSGLLARARCLLHPTLAPETSSLVAMEALAAGTPVVAFRSGALPEIIEDGVTGFLVDSVAEMAEAMRDVEHLSSAACRRAAEQRFCRQRMIREYLGLYAKLACQPSQEKQVA